MVDQASARSTETDAEETFDLFIPVAMHPILAFAGPAGRDTSFNDETACRLCVFDATLHRIGDYRYLIVRTALPETEAYAAMDLVCRGLLSASLHLDVGMRPAPLDPYGGAEPLDLLRSQLFPAGRMPQTRSSASGTLITMPVGVLEEASEAGLADLPNVERAATLFRDIDFEASLSGRFVLLSTVLELVSERSAKDEAAQALIDKWAADAADNSRTDLRQALQNLRQQSITSAVLAAVRSCALSGGCSETEADGLCARVGHLYRLRHSLVHGGGVVSVDDLNEYRSIVRFMLTGDRSRGMFSGIVAKVTAQEDFDPRLGTMRA